MQKETPKKLSANEALRICKQDFSNARTQRDNWDIKIKEWRSAYHGEPYGNEVEGKAAIVSRDVRRQSEWQNASLVDPFISEDNPIKVYPIGASDRDSARQKEIILNTQFCRQFPRYTFMAKAVKVLDRDGTVIVMCAWDYKEQTNSKREIDITLEDGSILSLEKWLSLQQELADERSKVYRELTLNDYKERKAQQERYEELTEQLQQAQELQQMAQQIPPEIMQGLQEGSIDPASLPPEVQQVLQQVQEQETNQEQLMQMQEEASQLEQIVSTPLGQIGDPYILPKAVSIEERSYIERIAIEDHPTAKVCRNEDVFIDPTCQDNIEEAQFVIYRYQSTITQLKLDGRYKNLDKINIDGGVNLEDYVNPDETNFEFTDTSRKKLLVYEYWGLMDIDGDGVAEPIVLAWVGDTVIRLEDNPYPDKKHPFIACSFMPVPFYIYGEANAELIGDYQKMKTAIFRGTIDNMNLAVNGQTLVRRGALVGVDKTNWQKGKNAEVNGDPKDVIFQPGFNQIPAGVFNTYGLLTQEIEAITGVRSFAQGFGSSTLGNAASALNRQTLDSTAIRRLLLVKNISENLVKPILKKWLAYDLEFLDETTIIRYTDEESIAIERDMLKGQYDIDIQISTSEESTAKAQQLAFLLQTLGQTQDIVQNKMLMSEIARLNRMPYLAKQIESYQPEPDPAQQRIQELQIQLLEAQVQNEFAKAKENESDVRLKEAKAQEFESKAKLTSSKADISDLDFLQTYQDVKSGKPSKDQIKEGLDREKMESQLFMNKEKLESAERIATADREAKYLGEVDKLDRQSSENESDRLERLTEKSFDLAGQIVSAKARPNAS